MAAERPTMGTRDVTVRQSRLTKHWIVDPGMGPKAEGFRRWVDAMAEADRRAQRYRAMNARTSRRVPA